MLCRRPSVSQHSAGSLAQPDRDRAQPCPELTLERGWRQSPHARATARTPCIPLSERPIVQDRGMRTSGHLVNIRRQPANSLRDRFQFLSGSSRLQRQLSSQQYRLRRQSSQFLAEDIMKFTGNSFTFFVPNRHQSARQHAQLFVALQQGRLRVLSRRHNL